MTKECVSGNQVKPSRPFLAFCLRSGVTMYQGGAGMGGGSDWAIVAGGSSYLGTEN